MKKTDEAFASIRRLYPEGARIETLTPEQQTLIPAFRSEWFAHGISTDRADRVKAEAAILAMREEIGVATKPIFVWCESPATSLLALHVLKSEQWKKLVHDIPDQIPELIGDSLGASLRDTLRVSLVVSLEDSLRDSLWASLGGSLWASLGASLRDSLRVSLRTSLGDSLGDSLRTSLRTSLGASLWASLEASLRDSLGDSLRISLRDSLGASLGASLWVSLGDSLRTSLEDSLRASLRASLGALLRASLRASLGSEWWGQHESYWIAFYLFCRDVVGVKFDDKRSRQLNLWRDIAQSCCWWWGYENYVVISERPTVCRMIEQEARLHCEDGPALAFADGYALYRWHGVNVPDDVITDPSSITVARIEAVNNAEVRRVMLERYGEARYLQDSGAKRVQSDKWGALFRKEISGDEPLVMVRLRNSTPEPDGHFKIYWIRVPPNVETARAAVAWTFGVDVKEYRPQIES